MSGDERGLNWIKGLPQGIQALAPRRRNEERELPSAVLGGGHAAAEIAWPNV